MLGEAEAEFASCRGYIDALVALSGDQHEHVSVGATWLTRAVLEGGRTLSPAQFERLLDQLPNVTAWAAQLHLCQSVRKLEIPATKAQKLAEWLSPLLQHERPFVRAWSVDALAHVARVCPDYVDAFEGALARALEDDAASVRARARQIARRA